MTDFEGGKREGFELDNLAVEAGNESSNLYQEIDASSSGTRQTLSPDANGFVVLPEGVLLEDIVVQGRDLVINLADGSVIIIPDGAVIVPQLVVDGVVVPAETLAIQLNDAQINPEAGPATQTPSSGGNFAGDEGAIQDAFDLGNLLPYTELARTLEEDEEILPFEDNEPEIVIETPDNPIGVPNAIASVSEAGLPERGEGPEPEGTQEETNIEATSGTVVITSPDGISAIFINGQEITTPGQEIVTDLGILTIVSVDLDTGEIEFEYLLLDNTSGDDTVDPFAVIVRDIDGDEGSATLTVTIADDAPIAFNDTNFIEAGTYGPVDGNVVDNDVSGADGFPEGGAVTGFSNGGGSAAPGESLDGDYGTLILNADGSYTYVRDINTPGGVSDVFTYEIVDADGSTSSATLTIEIGDAPNEITFVPELGAGTVVEEAGLPPRGDETPGSAEGGDGDPNDNSVTTETTSGTITFNSPDGLDSVSVGGTAIDPGNLPQVVVDDATGTLVITDFTYDPVTGDGSFSYEYTLGDNTSGDDTKVDFEIVVIDLDGDQASDTLTINIVDDVPEAQNDSAGQAEENAPVTVSVLDNDTQGADGVETATVELVEGTLSGNGTLVNNGDGTFTYTPTADDDSIVTFDYEITDGDGDPSIATVTLTILPDSPIEIAVEGDDDVDEAGLAARGDEPAGSDEGSDSEFATGVIAIDTGNDTLASLVINGQDVTNGGTVTTSKGELTITVTNGEYSYSYELTDNTLTEPDSDAFTLEVTDSDGSMDSTVLTIAIFDDAPEAFDDAGSLGPGEFGPVEGNVLTNDTQGADGALVTGYEGTGGSGGVGETVQGTYGVLTINADGSYSYTRDPGTPGDVQDIFDYTITDSDGDPASAKLIISIGDAPVVLDLPVEGEGGTEVDEAGLAGPPAGSDAGSDSEFTTGTFTFEAADGVDRVLIDGVEVTSVGQTFAGAHGTLTIDAIEDGAITYTYELTSPTNGDTTFDDFEVRVEDNDDDFAQSTLKIAIVDDEPAANEDADSVTEDGPLVADGNLLTGSGGADANATDGVADVTGADGATVTGVAAGDVGSDVSGDVSTDVAGTYGSINVDANGDYVYTLDNDNPAVQGLDKNESLTEIFTYTITDGDGDPATTIITITINGQDDPVVINGLDGQGAEEIVDEDDLADGTSPDAGALTQGGTFTVDSPDGLATLTVGGASIFGGGVVYPVEVTGEYGTIFITGVTTTTDGDGDVTSAEISYEYVLGDNTLDHSDAALEDALTDSFAVVATDSDGSTSNASLDVDVIDDIPDATDNANSVTEGDSVDGDVLTDDDGNGVDVAGADGYASGGAVVGISSVNQGTSDVVANGDGDFIIAGQYGTLTLNQDGTYTYQANPNVVNSDETDTFTYTIRDGDGDESTAELVITVENVAGSVSDNDALVNEKGLPTGTGELADNDGANNSDTSETFATGQITVSDATGPFVFILEDPADGAFGTLTLNADGSYSYTLDTAFGHDPDAPGADTNIANGVESFAYRVEDTNGNVIGSGEIVVSVIDDIPQVDITTGNNAPDALETQDADTIGNASDTDTADFSGAFAIASSEFGADGAGTLVTTYALGLSQAEGTDSGLNSDGADIFLYQRDDGTIVGSTSNTEPATNDASVIFTLAVDAASGVVTLTQFAELDHMTSDTGAPFDGDILGLGNGLVELTATATITDGDQDVVTDSETIDMGGRVTFADDGPSVGDQALVQLDEDGNAGGVGDDDVSNATGTLNFDYGADGAGNVAFDTTGAPAGFRYEVDGNTGDILIQQDQGADGWVTVITVSLDGTTGDYTATSVDNILHPEGDDENNVEFTLGFTVTDGDGDKATGSLTINADDDTPIAVAASLGGTVDEDGLPGGIDNNGQNDAPGAETTATGSVASMFSAGADVPLTYGLVASASGLPALTSCDKPVEYAIDGNVLTGSVEGDPVFTFTVEEDGTWTFELLGPLDHIEGDSENVTDIMIDFGGLITATDADGDTVTATGSLVITVDDDSPVLTAPIADQSTSNDPDAPVLVGDLNFAPGADGASPDVTISADVSGLFVGGQPLATSQSGNVLTAYVDSDNSGDFNGGDVEVFTITVDPTAGTSGEYEFDLITPLDGETTIVDLLSDGAFGVGPSLSVIVSQDSTGDELVFVTGWEPNGNGGEFTNGELADWLAGGNPDLSQVPGVNGSTAGFGINSNNLNQGQFLRFDFGPLDDYDGAGGYTPPGGTDLQNATLATFVVSKFGSGDVTSFVAHFSDGTTQEFTLVGTGNGASGSESLEIVAPPGTTIAFVDVYQESGSVKLNLGDIGVTDTNLDFDIPVSVELSDKDGDPVSDDFIINISEDTPNAQDDLTNTSTEGLDLNVAFVIDFSSSINNTELDQELSAVRSAVTELFAKTGGTVSVTLIGFDEDSLNFGTFTELADVEALIESINPADGGSRPLEFGTSYTDGIAELMAGWDPEAGDVNQMFFISDGRASRDRGTDNYPLSDTVRAEWEAFVAANDFEITAIAVGDNQILAGLEAVDIDGNGSPILIENFDALIDTIVGEVILPVSGNVLDNDIAPAGGITITSITVDAVTYNWDGATITPTSGSPIAGSVFSATTAMGGELTFDFSDGSWTYVPSQGTATGMENFQYEVVDNDGDTDTAILRIDLTAINGGDGGSQGISGAFSSQVLLSSVEGDGFGDDSGSFGGGSSGTESFSNDNDLFGSRSLSSGQVAAAGFGLTMVNFSEMGGAFSNTSFTSAQGFDAFGGSTILAGAGMDGFAGASFATADYMTGSVFGDFSGVESNAYRGPDSGDFAELAVFDDPMGESAIFDATASIETEFAAGPAMDSGMMVDGGAAMMDALLSLSPDAGMAADLADASGLQQTQDVPDVVAILDDIMAEANVDAMLDSLAGNDLQDLATGGGAAALDGGSLTQVVDAGAFAFDTMQLADMSAEAAVLAASVG